MSSATDSAPIPVDPQLPVDFFNTRNEERSTEDLAAWWDKPFAQRRADGTLEVRCLDGGAWDRPTFYGVARTEAEAANLGRDKLAAWQQLRSRPTVMVEEGEFKVVIMPQHPHDEASVLGIFHEPEKATEFITGLDKQTPL